MNYIPKYDFNMVKLFSGFKLLKHLSKSWSAVFFTLCKSCFNILMKAFRIYKICELSKDIL
jgi:hypothetical protein